MGRRTARRADGDLGVEDVFAAYASASASARRRGCGGATGERVLTTWLLVAEQDIFIVERQVEQWQMVEGVLGGLYARPVIR
jgi:hypothetical protein